MDFRFYDPAVPVTVTQGHLPHWEQVGSTYFITWRTADSIPKQVWERWRRLRSEWLSDRGINPSDPDWRKKLEELPEEQRVDFRRFSKALEFEMDACHGTCPLKSRDCAEIVADSLRHFDGDRYLPKSPRGKNGRPFRSTSSSGCEAGFGRTKASIIWSGARQHSIVFAATSPRTRRRRSLGLASLFTGPGQSDAGIQSAPHRRAGAGRIQGCRLPPERLRSAQRTVRTTLQNPACRSKRRSL